MHTIKFPFLKNEFNDGHFDLVEPRELVAKSLAWFGAASGLEPSIKERLAQCLAKTGEAEEDNDDKALRKEAQALEALVLTTLAPILGEEERKMLEWQKTQFEVWNRQRKTLIEAQVRKSESYYV